MKRPEPMHPAVGMQYRSPWGEARIGRILEDLDSLTALVAFEHWCVNRAACTWRASSLALPAAACAAVRQLSRLSCKAAAPSPTVCRTFLPHGKHPTCLPALCCSDVADERSRPPLLVTAGVEAIELHNSRLSMQRDMVVRGQGRHGLRFCGFATTCWHQQPRCHSRSALLECSCATSATRMHERGLPVCR